MHLIHLMASEVKCASFYLWQSWILGGGVGYDGQLCAADRNRAHVLVDLETLQRIVSCLFCALL